MYRTPNGPLLTDEVLAVATEVIRREGDGCMVPISELLEELSHRFDRFVVTPDMSELLVLIRTLWDNPHIDQPQRESFEFAWFEEGSASCVGYCCDPELRAQLRESLITEPSNEDQ